MKLKITFLGTVSTVAVLGAATVAAVGVAGVVGTDSEITKIGTGVLIGGTLLTEAAAARLPDSIKKHMAANARGMAIGACALFAIFTGWNVTAGHMGMVAINHAGVEAKRAPLERAALDADAARITAEEALAAYDARISRRDSAIADGLRGAMAEGYVTSSTRALNNTVTSDPARDALAAAVAAARAADLRDEADLARAPNGRPDHELWFFAIIIELLKGALVFFAAPSARRPPGASIVKIDPAAIEKMTLEEKEAAWEALAEARSTSTTLWHSIRRDRKAA